ncbi:MAG: metallophosphoesterase [Deltaproteobacteria bacterium]
MKRSKISFVRWLFLVLALTLLASCGGETTDTANTSFPVVVVSDVHFDPFYDPTLFPALVAADADEWDNIFKTSSITTPSTWGSDANYPLLALTLAGIRQNRGASPFIVFTGDILVHHFSQTFYTLYGSQDTAAMQAFADKTVAFFLNQLKSSAGDLPILFTLGNNDAYTDYAVESSFLSNTAEIFYTKCLDGVADHQAFLDTYLAGGYYNASPAGKNLMVISLNTILLMETSAAATAQLAWFDATLAQARAAGKKVWLFMHVPPGADIYLTARLVDNKGHLASARMMWQPDYQTSFLQILAKYPDIITFTLAGHTHMDEYRIVSSSHVLDITPGISPRSGNNPAFKVFTIFSGTFEPVDYRSINYDFAAMPVQFNNYDAFWSAYLMQGFLDDSLTQLFPALVTNHAKQTRYRSSYYSGYNILNSITNTNWPVYWCGIGKMGQQELIDCVNAY